MAIKREHHMDFGCALLPSGAVCFQLWAPGTDRVALSLESDGKQLLLPIPRGKGGWFSLETADAGVGSRYGFELASGLLVPDPASRFQPEGVHGPSEVVDPANFVWDDEEWQGRPWHEAVLYELHVGTFSAEGTFAGVEQHLDHLVGLGVTAIELMPVAAFPGRCNWGYDGVLPFAPVAIYGRPEDLKKLICAAHARELMVLLDVVYNHLGPEGNYLASYAPFFFTDRYQTPWGAAINFDGAEGAWVRRFFIENALYWLNEYHLDGLRLDAVHAIHDQHQPHILEELAWEVQAQLAPKRHIHLLLENDRNQAHYLRPDCDGRPACYRAQWNDDLHHGLHVLLTGETSGYYGDYAPAPVRHVARCLAEGFSYQGENSPYRHNRRRGEPSSDLPSLAFVTFLQNHDQIGNRALGERLTMLAEPTAIRAALALLLLAPSPPLLFMGEEGGCCRPFPFFCDFEPELADRVREGRCREFSRFPQFSSAVERARIPDPTDFATFLAAKLDWQQLTSKDGAGWHAYYGRLLTLRRRQIIPRLPELLPGKNDWQVLAETGLAVRWPLRSGGCLQLFANLGPQPCGVDSLPGLPTFFASHDLALPPARKTMLPPWSVFWFVGDEGREL